MRGFMGLALASAASLGIAAGGPPVETHDAPRQPKPKRKRIVPEGYRSWNGLPAGLNRHTGKPHANERAISRRLRQAENVRENRAERALRDERRRGVYRTAAGQASLSSGLTRRGRRVAL